jgi:hypothetical protein
MVGWYMNEDELEMICKDCRILHQGDVPEFAWADIEK